MARPVISDSDSDTNGVPLIDSGYSNGNGHTQNGNASSSDVEMSDTSVRDETPKVSDLVSDN